MMLHMLKVVDVKNTGSDLKRDMMTYGRAIQLTDCGPNPDLSSVKTGPQAPG